MKSVKITPKKLNAYDACVVVTDHTLFDFELIKEYSNILIDTRGVFSTEDPKVYRA